MKISNKIEEQAQKLMADNDYPDLYINKHGEFFTSENLALVSVGNKKADVCHLEKETNLRKMSRHL